jgi:CHAT domain-containing protein/Tfp pilus assembly protein PilF
MTMTMNGQRRRSIAATCILLSLLLPVSVRADDVEEIQFQKLAKEFEARYDAGQYAEAEPIVQQMMAIAEKSQKPEWVAKSLGSLTKLYRAQGRYAEAEAPCKRALAICQTSLGADSNITANAMTELAEVHRRLGRYADAEPLFQQAVAIREKVLGRDHPEVATTLNLLANLYKDRAQYAKAEPLHKRALAIREKALGPDHKDVGVSLNNLAILYEAQARFSEAAELYQRAIAIQEKNLGPNHPDVAVALTNLGTVRMEQGRFAEAETMYQRANTIREKALGPDHPSTIQGIDHLARLRQTEGKFSEAEPLLHRALAATKKTFGPNHPSVAANVNLLAKLFYAQGRCQEAEPLFKRGLTIREKALPPNHPDIASSLNDLATMYKTQGRYAEAEPLYKRSLAIRYAAYPPDHPSIAQSLSNLANLYHKQGRDSDADSLYKRALAIREKVFGPDHPNVAVTLASMADLDMNQGRYAQAESRHRRALAIREKAFGSEHPEVAWSLSSLARVYYRQRRYAEAASLCNRALVIVEKVYGPDHIAVASTLSGLIDIDVRDKRYDEAAKRADRAITILDRSGASPDNRSRAYYQRADIQWKLGHKVEALADLRRAMELAEQQRGMASGGERERAQLFARFSSAFDRMIDWQVDLGDCSEALDAMERSRARSLLDQIETHGIDLLAGVSKKRAAGLLQREAELQTRLASLEKQLQILEDRKDLPLDERKRQADALRSRLRKTRADYVVLYADIRNASPAYRLALGQDHKPVTLEKVNRWVAEQNSACLEYRIGRDTACVLILRAGTPPRLQRLTVTDDQARVLGIQPGPLTSRKLGVVMANKKQTGVAQLLRKATNPAQIGEVSAKLAALWNVLIPQSEQTALKEGKLKRLVVIPDGPLGGLPFETLIVQAGENPQYLLDIGPPIEYAPSATILMNLQERRQTGKSGATSVLTVGDARYPPAAPAGQGGSLADLAASSRYAGVGGRLGELPFTKEEVAWVAKVFIKSGVKVTELLRDQATEANVCRGSSGQKILHLACHGLVDQAYGNLFGALALTPGPNAANQSDDGFLTLAEIYRLHLDDTQLAILSACDTNLGPQQDGEGVYALSRGFLVAGARRVVASNWLVDDEAAASLIGRFCGEVAADEEKDAAVDYAEALWRAKRWVRHHEGWESPYYWGTFVLIGPN